MAQWVTVLFTDKSRFSLNTDSRRTFIWREPGTRYLPSNVREIDHYGGGGLMVWAGIMLDGRTPLHVFERGAVTGVSKAAAILLCKSATNLTRQECKLEASLCKRQSHHASNLSQACGVKLIANYSKNTARTHPRIRTRALPLPKPVSLTTRPTRL
ncbi:hypothetical protein AVEN_101999-1 [Araneus ventricosus]|uniref:Transposable element Tc1 transposase n=1 Tax=Araneus ventricosus TaxID=182803 RepID=A0A4Y2I9V0_ARAVE|nr:hypothetical protein AVEN_101999-1 [Araneus ventricosus]